MQEYAISNGLYLINYKSENVYYTPAFYVNPTEIAIQILLYAVPRSLPARWTTPSNWIGYSTFTSDRTPYITILANNFQDHIGFRPGNFPPSAPIVLQSVNYSVLSNKKTPIASYANSIIVHCSLVNNPVVSPSDI